MGLGISPIPIVKEMAKEITDKSDVQCNIYKSAEDVPDPRELSSEKQNLMVVDGVLLEKQNTCESYNVRGQHSNVDCFYLIQLKPISSSHVKQSERTRFSCLFPQDLKNHIFEDHVGSDMTKEELRKLCKTAWKNNTGL